MFSITATAVGGASFTDIAYLKVQIDCSSDVISIQKIMPNASESGYRFYK